MEHNISLRDDLNVALDCRSIAIVVPYGAPDKIEWMKDCRPYWQTSHKALTDVEIKKWLPEYKNEYEQWGVYSPMWVSPCLVILAVILGCLGTWLMINKNGNGIIFIAFAFVYLYLSRKK